LYLVFASTLRTRYRDIPLFGESPSSDETTSPDQADREADRPRCEGWLLGSTKGGGMGLRLSMIAGFGGLAFFDGRRGKPVEKTLYIDDKERPRCASNGTSPRQANLLTRKSSSARLF